MVIFWTSVKSCQQVNLHCSVLYAEFQINRHGSIEVIVYLMDMAYYHDASQYVSNS